MIEEIKDFGNDLKKGLGKNGFYLVIGGAVLFGLYNLLKSDTTDDYVSATGYASYPDAPENATQIVDELSQEIWASNYDITGSIQTSESEIIDNINDHFEETNNYISEGLANKEKIMQKIDLDETPKVIADHGYIYHDYSSGSNVITHTPTDAYKPKVTTTTAGLEGKQLGKQPTSTAKKSTTSAAKKSTTSTAKKSTTNSKTTTTPTTAGKGIVSSKAETRPTTAGKGIVSKSNKTNSKNK